MPYKKPAYGYITSFFAPSRLHPKDGVIRAHQGVDIGSTDDNRIWAAAAGRVAQIGYSDTAGNFVLIRHSNGDTTSYSHLASTSVKYLQTVEQGQVIGVKGRTGSATGVHLHFEIVRGKYTNDFSKKLDPLLYFKDPLTEEQQGLLVKLGYKLDVDGYYGSEMKAAVAQYQKDRGLTTDGYAGRATHTALKADVASLVAADNISIGVVHVVKIALDAGHGFNTPGKRTPDGEREWSFNSKVLVACQAELQKYEGVEILRLDDPTGKTDVPLKTRTNRANTWKADVLVSIHHNANTAKWGGWGGVETYVYPTAGAATKRLAESVNSGIVSAMELRNRGVKTMNLHMVRESNMPAILTEGGFMDSTTDIDALRDDSKLRAQGVAIAEGLASHFGLKLKAGKEVAAVSKPKQPTNIPSPSHKTGWEWAEKKGYMNGERPKEGLTREQFASVMMKIVSDLEKNK